MRILSPLSLIDAAKHTVTVGDILSHYGVCATARGHRRQRIPCPIHRGTHANFSFTDERFNCFSCGQRGDCVDLEQQLGGGELHDALERLRARHALAPATIDWREQRRLKDQARIVNAWYRRRATEWSSALVRAEALVREWQADEDNPDDYMFWIELQCRCEQRDRCEAMVETFAGLRTLAERARAYAAEQRGAVVRPHEVW